MLPMNVPLALTFSALGLVFALRQMAHRVSLAGGKRALPELDLTSPHGQPVTPSARGLGRLHPQFRTKNRARGPLTCSNGVYQRTVSGYPARWSRARFTITLKRPASS